MTDKFTVSISALLEAATRLGEAAEQLEKANLRVPYAEAAATLFGESTEGADGVTTWNAAVVARGDDLTKIKDDLVDLESALREVAARYARTDEDSEDEIGRTGEGRDRPTPQPNEPSPGRHPESDRPGSGDPGGGPGEPDGNGEPGGDGEPDGDGEPGGDGGGDDGGGDDGGDAPPDQGPPADDGGDDSGDDG